MKDNSFELSREKTAPILFNIIIHDLPKVLQITYMWRNMQMILLFGLTQVLESIQIRGW